MTNFDRAKFVTALLIVPAGRARRDESRFVIVVEPGYFTVLSLASALGIRLSDLED